MLTVKVLIGLGCFFYPSSAEGGTRRVHADQMTCDKDQALTNRLAT